MRQSRNVGLLLCCALAPAPEPAQRHEPRGMFEWFRVDLVSRARRPLELGHAKQEQAGSSFRCYLDGATSSVVFPYGETLVIDAPVEEPTKLDEQKKNPDIKLERLALKNGRRYATGSYIPLIVTDTGEQVQIVAPQDKKKNRPIAARIYWYGNAQTLAPGEYAVSWRGMARDYLGCSFTGAFRISADVPAAQHSAPARHPAPPSAPQTPAVPTDMRQLREAAERGDRAAQQQLGYSYGTGTDVPQDYELAALWFRKAAAQGSMEAQYMLGTMHRDGLGMPKDDAQAFQLFRQSAEQGYPAAQSNLGHFYYVGRGVTVDFVEAHKWLNLGTARLTGDAQKQSAALRDEIGGKLLPSQLADAQKRAREWLEASEKRRP